MKPVSVLVAVMCAALVSGCATRPQFAVVPVGQGDVKAMGAGVKMSWGAQVGETIANNPMTSLATAAAVIGTVLVGQNNDWFMGGDEKKQVAATPTSSTSGDSRSQSINVFTTRNQAPVIINVAGGNQTQLPVE